jgi:hypothetical protein
VRSAGRSGAGLEEKGASGSAVWGAKLGLDGSLRRGRRVKGQNRGIAWRVVVQASRPQPPKSAIESRLRCAESFRVHEPISTSEFAAVSTPPPRNNSLRYMVQGWRNRGPEGSTVWGAKLGSDGSPRRGRRVKGQSRGTAWRVILQARPATLPSERAMNRVSVFVTLLS